MVFARISGTSPQILLALSSPSSSQTMWALGPGWPPVRKLFDSLMVHHGFSASHDHQHLSKAHTRENQWHSNVNIKSQSIPANLGRGKVRPPPTGEGVKPTVTACPSWRPLRGMHQNARNLVRMRWFQDSQAITQRHGKQACMRDFTVNNNK